MFCAILQSALHNLSVKFVVLTKVPIKPTHTYYTHTVHV